MTFEIIKGDLFDPAHNFDALAQGVNTQGLMGAGIAVVFRNRDEAMYQSYRSLCDKFGEALAGLVHTFVPDLVLKKGPMYDKKDGTISSFSSYYEPPVIYNMFSQVMPGKNGDYRLLQQAAITVLMNAEADGYNRVGLPWIGCGIAGLEKHNVEHIFRKVFSESHVKFVLVEQ